MSDPTSGSAPDDTSLVQRAIADLTGFIHHTPTPESAAPAEQPAAEPVTEPETETPTPDPVSEVIASTPIGSVFIRTHGGWSVQIPGINGVIGHGVGASIQEAIASIGAVVTAK